MSFLLFDLGGVVVDMPGARTMLEATGLSESECWRRWFDSPSVHAFETGTCSPGEFARGLLQEFGLAWEPEEFLEDFATWPTGLYPGARELLVGLRDNHTLACLSNINEIHWDRAVRDWNLDVCFHHCFASHLIHKAKPDTGSFQHVLDSLELDAPEVVFFDDTRANVEAARTLGMEAYQVRGPGELRQKLVDLGLMDHEDTNRVV